MKKHQIIFTSVFLMFSMFSCKVTDSTGIHRIHKYVNNSGVEVAMVGEAYGNIPDSLVIPNGETYECSLRYPGMQEYYFYAVFPYDFGDPYDESKFIPLKVYYNENICLTYTYDDDGKNPVGVNNGWYDKVTKRSKNLITVIYTYTFTPEDYLNAIDAQK